MSYKNDNNDNNNNHNNMVLQTHGEHLHEELLLLLLGTSLSVLVHLVAAGGQEAEVVVEED